MIITVVGIGYVGLVTAACFAEMGNTVTCVDSDARKIGDLRAGKIPIHEPGLDVIVARNARDGRLAFTTSLDEALRSTVFFIAAGTPPASDGSADVTQVLEIGKELGAAINDYAVIVSKSTVPVGTSDRLRVVVRNEIVARGASVEFDVVSNPEFLKEGSAVNDFTRPDRVVLGSESSRALDIMRSLYAPFVRNRERVLTMGLREAEMTKYAANAMLVTRISFMNEIANLCGKLGVDVESVRKGVGADSRIGHAFLYPGCGYGGSCLPKDVKALLRMGHDAGLELSILRAAEERNVQQKRRLFDMIAARFGPDLSGQVFGLWGLSFKPETDDVREASALTLIELLLEAGATMRAYDPVAAENTRKTLDQKMLTGGRLAFVSDQYAALDGAQALVLVTEWKQFRSPDFQRIKAHLRAPVIFDGRNQYDPAEMAAMGFEYYGIGRGARPPDRGRA